jgi:hypothetical protein
MHGVTWRQLERQTYHALEAHGLVSRDREIRGWDELKRWAPKKRPPAKG